MFSLVNKLLTPIITMWLLTLLQQAPPNNSKHVEGLATSDSLQCSTEDCSESDVANPSTCLLLFGGACCKRVRLDCSMKRRLQH